MDISVIVTTYNRATILRDTLASVAALRPHGLTYEIIVVDNNSTDDTADVVRQMQADAPVRYLFEARQGMSSARNAGVEASAGVLLVFTDDDVVVPPDWLDRYWQASREPPFPDYLGGNVVARMPKDIPRWADLPCMDFGALNLGATSRMISKGENFIGANMAVQRSVFDRGVRFDATIGPTGRSTIRKGCELALFAAMRRSGSIGWFVAGAPVIHRADAHPWLFSLSYQLKRKYQTGRGETSQGLRHLGRRRVAGMPMWPWFQVSYGVWRLLVSSALLRPYTVRLSAAVSLAHSLGILAETCVLWNRRLLPGP